VANRAYLYNTEQLIRNPYDVREGKPGIGRSVEVAEQARWLPLPWMLAFRPQDTYAFTHTWVEDEEDPSSERKTFEGLALAASRDQAVANLRASLPVWEKVVGEPRTARAYLDDAIAAFSGLELPYVLLDAEEVIDGSYDQILAALGGSVEVLRDWASYSGHQWPLQPHQPVPRRRDEDGLWCGFGADLPEEEDEPEAVDQDFEALQRAGLAGDVEAQFKLGEMTEGSSASGDWYTRAAKAGHVEAQARLAAYYSMQGTPVLAMKWLKSAAQAGHVESAGYLGRILQGTRPGEIDMIAVQYAGQGEHPPDYDQSFAWLEKAAAAGSRDPAGWLLLGEMTFNGIATSQDHAAAARWFKLAADAGNEKAQMWMAIVTYHGFGVKQDRAAAARWVRGLADKGSALGQFAMGLLYFQGHGVEKDAAAGRRWMEKAAERGDENAIKFLAIPAWKFWARRGFFTGLL
jgi:TPR repeat protein